MALMMTIIVMKATILRPKLPKTKLAALQEFKGIQVMMNSNDGGEEEQDDEIEMKKNEQISFQFQV